VIGTVAARDVLDAIEKARLAPAVLHGAADQRTVRAADDAEQAAAAVPS
jgi:hypothetical protein